MKCHPPMPRQQGAATLVVVMMLFLVMALIAAYANRSLMFEQRISGSYSRASLAQEVAEGGIEWTLAQLNGPAIDQSCKPVSAGGQRFVDKYLAIDPTDRTIRLAKPPKDGKLIFADCTRDVVNKGWECRCADLDQERVKPASKGGTDVTPSFRVRMVGTSRAGTFELGVRACTDSVIDNCGQAGGSILRRSQVLQGVSRLDSLIALVSAVRNPPAAPLIVKGDLSIAGTGGLGLHNTDARSAGSLLAIGGTWGAGIDAARLQSLPGTAPEQARVQNDDTLKNRDAEAVFKMFMGASPDRYAQHPSLRTVACNGDCGRALEEAYAAGKRILQVDGPLTISSSATIGTAADPVVIVARNVTLVGSLQIHGMLVSQGDLSWTNTSALPSFVNGIVLVTGSMQTVGRMDVAYQQAIADHLQNRMGSFVRVPGTWIDGD